MSNLLSEFRKSKNMTMQEIANEIGVSKSYYEKIEYDVRQPSYNFIIKFVNKFPDVDADKIFFTKKTQEMCEKEDFITR